MKFVESLASYLPSLIVAYLLDPEEADPTRKDQRPARQRCGAPVTPPHFAPSTPRRRAAGLGNGRSPGLMPADGSRAAPPRSRSYETVCLFADVSGFTALSEAMSKDGPEGAEYVAKHVRAGNAAPPAMPAADPRAAAAPSSTRTSP